jgi:hypothetical protein
MEDDGTPNIGVPLSKLDTLRAVSLLKKWLVLQDINLARPPTTVDRGFQSSLKIFINLRHLLWHQLEYFSVQAIRSSSDGQRKKPDVNSASNALRVNAPVRFGGKSPEHSVVLHPARSLTVQRFVYLPVKAQ